MIATLATLAWTFVTASVAAWGWARPRPTPETAGGAPRAFAPRRILLLRPCAGAEAGLGVALASSAAIDAHAVRFLVADADDPAAPIAGHVARRVPRSAVVVTRARGPNAKADQLARALALETEPWDVLVVVDSDVAIDDELARALVDRLDLADCVWAPPVEVAPRTFADGVSAAVLGASLHSFALLANLDRRGMVGKAFAIRRSALEAVGGFEPLVHCLGEDMELSRRLRSTGRAVVATRTPARSLASGRDPRALVDRYTRWLSVIRGQRPALLASYPLLFGAAPLQLAAGGMAVALDGAFGLVAIVAAIAARALTAALARSMTGVGRTSALLPWLADLLLLLACARALAARTFYWRGAALRVERGGALVEVRS